MADMDKSETHKAHRAAHSGRKAKKKDAKKKKHHEQDLTARQRNPKAFAIQSATKAERMFRRTMDIKSKGYKMPTVDRMPENPPPAVVAVVGPPKVGKTTLLKGLIKNFTKQKITSIQGPVTLVSGKKKRVTFIECNNDINNMIDIAKIADMVLLLIDAKSGFEMETFEFMNICQVHGMPRLMGVLTHLDLFKNKKAMQTTKKALKRRFRTEIPRAEKMFFLSGMLHGEYLRKEMHNVGRFISVMKFELSSYKKSHPYILVDRMEDITDPEVLAKNPVANRKVCLYGYVRGGALKKNSPFHIPGCGDFIIKTMHFLPDPCPLPETLKKRSLNQKERLIYAPMSGVGGIVYDKDAVYIEVKDNQGQANDETEDKPSEKLVSSIVSVQHPIDEKMKATKLQLLPGEQPLIEEDLSSESDGDDDEEEEEEDGDDDDGDENDEEDYENDNESDKSSDNGSEDELSSESESDSENEENQNESRTLSDKEETQQKTGKKRKVRFEDEEDESQVFGIKEDSVKLTSDATMKQTRKKTKLENDDDFEEIGHAKWKDNLMKKAADDFYQRQKETFNLQKLVYGQRQVQETEDSDSDDEIGGLFRLAKHEKEKKRSQSDDGIDCSKFTTSVSRDWTDEKEMESIKDCFVTGKWDENEDAKRLLEEDDELYGDFEDYETGVAYKAEEPEKKTSDHEEENREENIEEDEETKAEMERAVEEKYMKKKELKEAFNNNLDTTKDKSYYEELKAEVDAQTQLNRKEFEDLDDEVRIQYEGYRPGLYLRLEVEDMPCEFVKYFDPAYPIIIGSLLKGEDKMGYLQVRIKKHRWYPKILKSRDPLIISMGWRRFQTIPLYYIVDHNMRNRHLKYTPKHLHCMAAFWGPISQQKAGIVGVQTVSEITSNFRIAAVGSVTEVNQMTNIVKKLKLIGRPCEIFKKTAFIEGMFHSALEVAKYEGAAIRTVSGIRGQIKKALRIPPGVFRATFEDKIIKSDIVFLRTWVTVTVPQFCITVTSLLLPPDQKAKWQGARTIGRLRYEKGLHAPVNEDSKYTPIERRLKQFAPLVVPKNLQKALPFKDKIVHKPKKQQDPENERVAVIKEPHEREVSKVLSMLKTVHKMKMKNENKAMWLRARAHRKEKHANEAIHHQKVQAMKKRILRKKHIKAPDRE